MAARTIDESLASAFDVYQAAADLILRKYSMRLLTADEGGLAPPCKSAEEMLALAVEAIELAGYKAGKDIFLGIDVASTHFYQNRQYNKDGKNLDSAEMIQTIANWLDQYPILSVEDGLAEDDWDNWPKLRQTIAGRALTLGDDLLCTNPARISRAINAGACDALLLKVNQIGTLTEAIDAYRLARAAGWSITLSVRSGETEDNWAADLAVGWRADQFKNGSIRQSETPAPAAFNNVQPVDTQGTIYPGLIELHNHLSYNALPLWSVPRPFNNRDQWTAIQEYHQLVTGPMNVLGKTPGYVEAI